MSATEQPTLLSVRQVADRLDVSIPTVRRWIAQGDLVALRLGRPGASLRITQGALVNFIGRTGTTTPDDAAKLDLEALLAPATEKKEN